MQAKPMNKSQTLARDFAEEFLRRRLDSVPERKDTLSLRLEYTDYGRVWLLAETDMLGLPEGNLLRAVARQHWMISIGKRGALDVYQAPKEFDQFKGRRAFGMHFKA